MSRRIQTVGFTFAFLLTALSHGEEVIHGDSRFGVGDSSAGSPAQFERRLNYYEQAGIGVLRLGIGWRNHETASGNWEESTDTFDMKLAVRNGFKLKTEIGSLSGPPTWFFQQHPDAQMMNQDGLKSLNVISYWYPGLKQLLMIKDRQLFAYAKKAGLLDSIAYIIVPFGPASEPLYPASWTTSDPTQPMRFWFFDPFAQANFPRKMQTKYGSIENANEVWGTKFSDWKSVRIPLPGTSHGNIWRDVLLWYRNSKREFISWQMVHYQALLKEYFPSSQPPRLMLLLPGNHVTTSEFEQAVQVGDGSDCVKMMCDSEFLLKIAHDFHADVQYTGLPNMVELEYLVSYMRIHHYSEKLWGENAGNQGDPLELGTEILANGLYGQEYIGSNLFDSDRTTPSKKYYKLKASNAHLLGMWRGKENLPLTFANLTIIQGGCIYSDQSRTTHLCLQSDGNLVIAQDNITLWSTNFKLPEAQYCSKSEDPSFQCKAQFQGDGNFVIYSALKPLWSSSTAGVGHTLLFSSIYPNLQILDSKSMSVWSSAH